MNIKEIAKLAGVSVSTVSKIINQKDANISDETRARVQKIVRENNYVPYSGVQRGVQHRRNLLGISLLGKAARHLALPLLECARAQGYSAIVAAADTPEQEAQNLRRLCSQQVDGILWCPGPESGGSAVLTREQIPFFQINVFSQPDPSNAAFNFSRLGYAAAARLYDSSHRSIFCLVDRLGPQENAFISGFQRCLFDHKIPPSNKMLCVLEHQAQNLEEYLFYHTGVACFSAELAARVYELARCRKKHIPKDLSVLSLSHGEQVYLQPELSVIPLPYPELAKYACRRLIAGLEGRRTPEGTFQTDCRFAGSASLGPPSSAQNKKVVVVGTVNMDTVLALREFPKTGATTAAPYRLTTPGGKGLNQAIGVARLETEAVLVGKVGSDYEGGQLLDYLQRGGVSTDHLLRTDQAATGQAYILVQRDGESGIVIYDGANGKLQPQDVLKSSHAFENAGFCLLQTELDTQIVETAAKLAHKEGARILLKPAAADSLGDELLKMVDIFLPNEQEINRLCPRLNGYEAKAGYFLERGVKNVIVTLGPKGCYWGDGKSSRYFPAAQAEVVDTTGAADAFAAALAVYLLKGLPMEKAISYATCAAGFSTTKRGAAGSLIDKTTLEFYMGESSVPGS